MVDFANDVLPWAGGGMIVVFFGLLVFGWTRIDKSGPMPNKGEAILGLDSQKEAAREPLKKPQGLVP